MVLLNIHQIDAKLAVAFQTDCKNLLNKFKDSKNYSFICFSQQWRELEFSSVTHGIDNVLMLQAFTANCFWIAKKFLYADDLYLQTGAIYLLYGLYYKQPFKNWVRIRLSLSDLDKIDSIIEHHKAQHFLDPLYIYAKMKLDAAVHLCVVPQPMTLINRLQLNHDLAQEEIEIKTSSENILNIIKELKDKDPDLEELKETNEEYQKLANKYKNKFFVFPSNVYEDLKKAYKETFNPNAVELSSEDHVNMTKFKAMHNANAVYRGDRKVLTAIDLDTP